MSPSPPSYLSIRAFFAIVGVAILAVALSRLDRRSSSSHTFKDNLTDVSSQITPSSSSSSSPTSPIDELVEWFLNNGGHLHESIEIRRQNHEDSTSPYGIFAKRDLPEGEVVLTAPKTLYFQLDQEDIVPEPMVSLNSPRVTQMAEEKLAMEAYYSNTCKLAHKLWDEINLHQRDPSSSKFAPYMRYLNATQSRGQIPAAYTPRAKQILRDLTGRKSAAEIEQHEIHWFGPSLLTPLVDWIDESFVQRGCLKEDDADMYHAIALVIQRGFDTELIPVWDMINHDNHRMNLASNSIHDGEGFKVWTSKAVSNGEELFSTYNFCHDCLEEGSGNDWGLPGIFRDFGFVEGYPQYWPFMDQNVFALIEEVAQDVSDQPMYHARFFKADGFSEGEESLAYRPTPEAVDFFRKQVDRVRELRIEEQVQSLNVEHERYMIARYSQALLTAMETIISTTLKVGEDGAPGEATIDVDYSNVHK